MIMTYFHDEFSIDFMKERKMCEEFMSLHFSVWEEQSLSLDAFSEKFTNSNFVITMFKTAFMFMHAKV